MALAGEPTYAKAMLPWLSPDLPIYGFGAIGLAADETPLASIPAIAALYISAIREVQPHGPYRVAGYSAGGAIAYEIAAQLIAANECIDFIGVIDGAIKSPTRIDALISSEYDPIRLFMEWFIKEDMPISLRDEIKAHADAKNIGAILASCQAANLISEDIDEDGLMRYIAVGHATIMAHSTYCPIRLSTRVSLFTSTEANPYAEEGYDTSLGWGDLLGPHLQHIPIGGNHQTIIEMPHVKTLGETIAQELARIS